MHPTEAKTTIGVHDSVPEADSAISTIDSNRLAALSIMPPTAAKTTKEGEEEEEDEEGHCGPLRAPPPTRGSRGAGPSP